ncbi:type II toxin-antitoxin system VapC family toxin [Desulfobulbus sp. F4]|nr:type II toxin-antitoxin system VapC family toxin [Desulfobulbus sp. F4]
MSSSYAVILDTCIVSYLMKGGPIAEAYAPHINSQQLLAISFITVGELYCWAEKNNWGEKRRQLLEIKLRNFIVIPYQHEIAKCYARIVAERNSKGRPVRDNDLWIAACAAHHSVPLITHNAEDFIGITGVNIITENQKGK